MPYPFQQLGGATSMQPGGGGFQEQQGGAVPMAQGGNTWFTQNAPQNTGVAGGAGGWTPDPTKKNAGIVVDESQKNDPNYILSVLKQTAQASGNPFDENQARNYWLPKIQASGGLSDYWVTRALPDQYGGGALMGGGGGGGGFGGADVMQQDPGYQFALQQGIDAVQRGAAAKGTLLTGGTQKELANYAAGLASQRYGDIFNRNLSLADLGLNAASRAAGLGSSYGQQAGQTLTQGGQAAATGSINQGNIWGNTLGNLGSLGAYYAGGGGQYPSQQGNPGLVQGYGLPRGFGELPPGIYG